MGCGPHRSIRTADNRRRRGGAPPPPRTQISWWRKMKLPKGNIDLGHFWYPPPRCKLPPLAISPPPTRETVTSMFFKLTCIVLVCVAHLLYAWPCIAFPYFKSSTCVCSVIFSLQRRCRGVLCCYFRPKIFSPGDHVRYHSRTLGAFAKWAAVLPHSVHTPWCRFTRVLFACISGGYHSLP